MARMCNYIFRTAATILILISISSNLFGITLDEAISKAEKYYPPLRERMHLKEASYLFYKASLDPYYPTISSSISYQSLIESSTRSLQRIWDRECALGLGISYRLFDGGYRRSKMKQAYLTFSQEDEEIKTIKNDLILEVKTAFYNVLAKERVLESRREAEATARRNYELAKERKKVGLTTLFDVTHAEVRYINARLAVVDAEKALEKAIGDLNSLIGIPLQKGTKVEGRLREEWLPVYFEQLKRIAYERRPEILKQIKEIKKVEQIVREYKSEYFPKIDSEIDFNWFDNNFGLSQREHMFLVTLSYNIFDGLGRYHRVSAKKRELMANYKRLDELKREIGLEVYKAYKDLEMAFSSLKIAKELVREAQINYNQAYGEYKVGKGDIIALIDAELALSQSREELIKQVLNYNLAISGLEHAVSVKFLK